MAIVASAAPPPPAAGRRDTRRADVIHALAIGTAIGLVYLPSVTNPLRIWFHHVIMLVAKAPQFHHDLFWHLVHYREAYQKDVVYFRVLSMPIEYGLARLFQDHAVLYYVAHLLAHFGVSIVLYRLALELTGHRTVSVVIAILFAVYSGHGDTVNLPLYTFMFVAMMLAGMAMLLCLRHLRRGDRPSLVLGVSAIVLATLVYDAFFLLALGLPAITLLLRRRDGQAIRGSVRTAALLTAAIVVVFAAVVVSLHFSPTLQAEPGGGITRSLQATLLEVARGGRVGWAVWYAIWALLTDAQVFFTGHLPALWHRGNMPYWDIGSLTRMWWDIQVALTLMLGGVVCVRGLSGAWRLLSMVPVLAGAYIDPKSVPLAVCIAVLLWAGPPPRIGSEVLLILAAGLLTSFNIALGRADGYNVVAFRHHYITGFFALLAIAHVVGARWRERPAWQRGALLGALSVCVAVNAWASVRVLEGVKRDNEMVLSFDRALQAFAERHGPASLFVAFSTGDVAGLDWRGSPAQDVAFDVLHYHRNPMTRYVNRPPFLVERNGVVRPNPDYQRPEGEDFLFRFRLTRVPARPWELFGSAPMEPRIVVDARGVSLVGIRRSDRRKVVWTFEFPPRMSLPVMLALSRSGQTLRLGADGAPVASVPIAGGREYYGWRSDDAGLLGRDFERALLSFSIYETYMRIGRATGEGI